MLPVRGAHCFHTAGTATLYFEFLQARLAHEGVPVSTDARQQSQSHDSQAFTGCFERLRTATSLGRPLAGKQLQLRDRRATAKGQAAG